MRKIDLYRQALNDTTTIEEIMSFEAHTRKLYYAQWEDITGWEFGSRTKRPPNNALNALISFGNTMMYTAVLKEIHKTALNPTISYLHEPSEEVFVALDITKYLNTCL